MSREHQVTVDERGSFTFAHCTCGWSAPARRSRDRSRRDATEHLAEEQPAGTPRP
ncbi:hypothetical protein [Kitasatospora sp. NPDC002040]|uniref:hypothetical protein n=1 Tax=Kitasatospora sp. NPDC002040 TaxID=3154661 RepID=UPI0033278AB4